MEEIFAEVEIQVPIPIEISPGSGDLAPLRDYIDRSATRSPAETTASIVRIKLILRGKRIGMTLQESVEVIDLYDPQRNNTEQLLSLINTISGRQARLLQQKDDIDDMLTGLNEVLRLCEKALGKRQKKTSAAQNN